MKVRRGLLRLIECDASFDVSSLVANRIIEVREPLPVHAGDILYWREDGETRWRRCLINRATRSEPGRFFYEQTPGPDAPVAMGCLEWLDDHEAHGRRVA